MRVKTHAMIVEQAYKLVKDYLPIELNKNIMMISSAVPDVMPHRRIQIHNKQRAHKEWQAFLKSVEKRRYTKAFLAYAAGVMSHYVSDTCCYAHNYYVVDLASHLQYEITMQNKIEQYEKIEIEKKEIFKQWTLLQEKGVEKYLQEQNEKYLEQVNKLETATQKMEFDVFHSILLSSVWMMEIAYVLSPGVIQNEIDKYVQLLPC